MHEVHLVRAILESVRQQAAAQQAKSVKWVKIRFNPLTSHSADHMRFSFDIVKQEMSLMRDAVLKLTELEPLLLCGNCGKKFHGHHLPEMCPKCLSLDTKPVNSTDMVLEGFELER